MSISVISVSVSVSASINFVPSYLISKTHHLRLDDPLDVDQPATQLKTRGANELVHSMVSSGCISARFPHSHVKEEIVWPPRELVSTQAQHIATGLIQNLEMLMGMPFKEALEQLSDRFGSIGFILVGDAASANMKFVNQFFAYLLQLGNQSEALVTCVFTQCCLHQMSRLLALHLEHHRLSASLFSVSRLNQQSNARDQVKHAMKQLLKAKFEYRPNQTPPESFFQSAGTRSKLLNLLGGTWEGEDGSEPEVASARLSVLKETLEFFNGDLFVHSRWTHFCRGCHANEGQALEHAALLSIDLLACCGISSFSCSWSLVFLSKDVTLVIG